jgi:chorismate synthase
MSNIWGMNLKLSIFGESHGDCVGVVVSNLPAGIELDLDKIQG